MEEILNKIIEIDNKSKEIVELEKNKKEKLDEFIEHEYTTKKVVLDLNYNEDIKMQKEKSNNRLNEEKEGILKSIRFEMDTIEKKFKDNEQEIVNDIVKKVKCLEE